MRASRSAGLVWIPETTWTLFDPIEREMYAVLSAAYPSWLSPLEICKRLRRLCPDENGDYYVEDVTLSIAECMSPYLEMKNERFRLKKL